MNTLLKKFNNITAKQAIWIIIGLGLVVYFNVLFNGFVGDDIGQIISYTQVHSISNLLSFFSRVNSADAYYRPIMFSFFTLIYSMFGAHAFPFHLFSIAVYVLNSVLVFLLLRKFFDKKVAFVLSLIFLVSPMNAEVVQSISALQDALFLLFGISALLLATRQKFSAKTWLGINLLLLISLLSKETGIVFIILVPIYFALFYRPYLLKSVIVSILALGEYLFFRLGVAHFFFAPPPVFVPIASMSLLQRIISMPKIVLYYLQNFIFPTSLATWQVWVVRQASFTDFWFPLLVVLLLLGLLVVWGWRVFRNNKPKFGLFLFFSLWLCMGLGFHLQIVPLDSTVADRWFYLPSIGLLGLMGVGWEQLNFRPNIQKWFTVLFVVIIAAFSIRTIVRNSNFHDNLTLFEHDSKVTPDSNLLQNALGVELWQDKQYDAAGPYLVKATTLAPQIWGYWYDLASYYVTVNNYPQAEVSFLQAANLSPTSSFPAVDYASLLIADGKYPEAIDYATNALQKYPKDSGLLLVLSVAEYKLNSISQASEYLQQSNNIQPSYQAYYVYTKITQQQVIDGDYLIKSFLNLN